MKNRVKNVDIVRVKKKTLDLHHGAFLPQDSMQKTIKL